MLISLIISTYYAVHIGDVDWEVMSNGEIKQMHRDEGSWRSAKLIHVVEEKVALSVLTDMIPGLNVISTSMCCNAHGSATYSLMHNLNGVWTQNRSILNHYVFLFDPSDPSVKYHIIGRDQDQVMSVWLNAAKEDVHEDTKLRYKDPEKWLNSWEESDPDAHRAIRVTNQTSEADRNKLLKDVYEGLSCDLVSELVVSLKSSALLGVGIVGDHSKLHTTTEMLAKQFRSQFGKELAFYRIIFNGNTDLDFSYGITNARKNLMPMSECQGHSCIRQVASNEGPVSSVAVCERSKKAGLRQA